MHRLLEKSRISCALNSYYRVYLQLETQVSASNQGQQAIWSEQRHCDWCSIFTQTGSVNHWSNQISPKQPKKYWKIQQKGSRRPQSENAKFAQTEDGQSWVIKNHWAQRHSFFWSAHLVSSGTPQFDFWWNFNIRSSWWRRSAYFTGKRRISISTIMSPRRLVDLPNAAQS